MVDTCAENENQKNASEFARSIPSKAEGIALCSAFILSSLFITAGNSLIVVLFAVGRALRKKGFFLVMNMAFADLMLGAFALPFYLYLIGEFFQLWTEKYDHQAFLILYRILDNTFLFGSYLSAVFISCERFHAVFWPFKHRSLSNRTYHITIFILWTLAVSLSTILTLLSSFSSCESSLYVVIPVLISLTIIMCVCNIGIWRNIQLERATSQHQNRALRRKRLTKTLLFVSLLALLSWLPLLVMNILKYLTKTTIPWKFYFVVNILNYSNSFVNPVVYALRIPEFQQVLRSCCKPRERRATVPTKQIEKRNRTAAPTEPEKELRIHTLNPAHLQKEFEQEDMETHFD